MRLLPPDREAYLYVITCPQGLTKIGVAADANERLRKMQVDSPVPLELVYAFYHPRAEDAYAVLEDLKRQLAPRQEHGRWYQATAAQVRFAFGNRSACQAARAAAEARLAAPAAELEAEQQRKARLGERRRSRAQRRRQKLRAPGRALRRQ
jgi:predicted GIY-YIG superfamily endonuclease